MEPAGMITQSTGISLEIVVALAATMATGFYSFVLYVIFKELDARRVNEAKQWTEITRQSERASDHALAREDRLRDEMHRYIEVVENVRAAAATEARASQMPPGAPGS